MAAFGYTLRAINDIPLSDNIDNLFADQGGRVLQELSLVLIYLNAEDVDVTAGIRIGNTEVMKPLSRITLQSTVGVMPIIPDDLVCSVMAQGGDEIIVSANNADAAAAAEIRGTMLVIPGEDVAIQQALAAQVGQQTF